MAEIDRLSIKLTADASSAKRSVNSLVTALETLNKALGSLDVGNLNNFNHVVGQLAASVSALSNATAGIRETAKAFNELGKSASNVKKAKDATQELANTSTSLMVVSNAITDVAAVSDSLTNVFGKIQSSFSSISGGTQRLIGDMGVIRSSFNDATEPINQLAVRLQTLMEGFREFVNVIYSISGSNQKLIEESNIIDGTFREVVEPINSAGNALQVYSQEQNNVSQSSQNLAENLKKVQEATLEDAPSESMDKHKESTDRATEAVRVLKAGYEGFVVVVKKVGSAFATISKRVLSATTSFHVFRKAAEKAVSNIPKATDLAKKFGKEITRIGKMLKLMVTRMALRKVIAEVGNGFKSLALHSDEFNNSVSSIMNSAKRLGYSFAAMVSPLINALAPALVKVINLFIKLSNAINQTLAALTGASSWNKAREFTDDWRESIEDANKDAKELKKTVLGFDELNQMQAKSTGGSTKGNIDDMFDTEKIDPKWKNLADWFKKMWELGDFTELGAKLGKKLRDALESIPWDQIRQTANKLGGALATLINGFVEVERLGYDIGKTIAQSINTVFEFLNGFVHKLHWDSIGKFLAETFNGFFENIDWALIKDTVVTGMAGIAEALQSFIENFNWDNISNFIINAVDVIVSGIKAFVEGVDWRDLGEKMGDQLRKTINGIDWKEVGEALGEIIQAAIDWVAGVLDTMPSAEELVQAATDFLDGLFDKVDSQQLGEEVATILNGIYNFLVGFWAENGDKIKEEVKKFFEGFWEKIDKEALKNVLGILLGVAVIGGIAAAGWTAIKTYFANKFAASITAKALSKALGGKIAAGVTEAATGEAVAGAATSAGASIGASILAGLAAYLAGHELGNWFGKQIFPEDAELYEQYSGISGMLNEVKDVFVGVYDLIDMKIEGAGRTHVEMTEEQKQKLEELRAKAAETNGEVGASTQKMSDEVVAANKKILDSMGYDENSLFYKHMAEDMDLTAEKSKEVASETQKAANAVKTSSDAVDKLKKSTKDGTDQTRKYVEAKRQSVAKLNELTGAENKAADSTNKTSGTLDNLSKTNEKVSKSSKQLATDLNNSYVKTTAEVAKAVSENEKSVSTAFKNMYDQSALITTKMPKEFVGAMEEITKSEEMFAEKTRLTMEISTKSVEEGSRVILSTLDRIQKAFARENWTFQGVADGLGETFRRAKEAIKREWNQIAETLNGEHEVGGGKMKIDLPKFAMGGFPRENGVFMANSSELVGRFDNGRTAVANNEQIIAGISQGVYNAVTAAMSRNANNGNAGYIANTIVVDGEVIARTVTKAQQKQNMRYSPVMG